MNPLILRFLNQDKVFEVLIGENEFFIPDHTFRDKHDLILVFNTLIPWARTNEKEKIVSKKIFEAIGYLADKNEIIRAIDLFRAFQLSKNHFENEIKINEKEIKEILKSSINRSAIHISQNEETREYIISVSKHIPELIN